MKSLGLNLLALGSARFLHSQLFYAIVSSTITSTDIDYDFSYYSDSSYTSSGGGCYGIYRNIWHLQ